MEKFKKGTVVLCTMSDNDTSVTAGKVYTVGGKYYSGKRIRTVGEEVSIVSDNRGENNGYPLGIRWDFIEATNLHKILYLGA